MWPKDGTVIARYYTVVIYPCATKLMTAIQWLKTSHRQKLMNHTPKRFATLFKSNYNYIEKLPIMQAAPPSHAPSSKHAMQRLLRWYIALHKQSSKAILPSTIEARNQPGIKLRHQPARIRQVVPALPQ